MAYTRIRDGLYSCGLETVICLVRSAHAGGGGGLPTRSREGLLYANAVDPRNLYTFCLPPGALGITKVLAIPSLWVITTSYWVEVKAGALYASPGCFDSC